MNIKILKDFDGHTKGDVITVNGSKNVPSELYWRNRLKDAEIDGCVKVVKTKKRGK